MCVSAAPDRHHIKHFLSVRPYYKGIDYYVARMSSVICTPQPSICGEILEFCQLGKNLLADINQFIQPGA